MFSVMDTMVVDCPKVGKHIRRLAPHVRRLEFSLNTLEPLKWRPFFEKRKCWSFLGSMQMLESLRFSTFALYSDLTRPPELAHIFRDNAWQNLSRLELSRLVIDSGELSSLLGRHISTLQILALQHIGLLLGSWYDVFSNLRGAALRVVKAYHLTEASSFPYLSDGLEELYFDQIPSPGLLDAFLFRGGSWGPHVNRELANLELEQNIDLSHQ